MKEVDSEEEIPAEILHTFRNLGRSVRRQLDLKVAVLIVAQQRSLTLLRYLRNVSLRATARKAGDAKPSSRESTHPRSL